MKTYSFLLILILLSCGPTKEEVAQHEKHIADSLNNVKVETIRLAYIDSIAKAQAELERLHSEKVEAGKAIKRNKLNNILEELQKNLLTNENELKKINDFQLGRSVLEKENQLFTKQLQINELKNFIVEVEKELALTHIHNSFEFQTTPIGTVQYIFTAAKNNEFDDLRHLLDPYGEFDADAQFICLVSMFPIESKKLWNDMFSNGRIMGDPTVSGDEAEIEIAIGSSSNRLEKIKLVKRMDRWYILSM